jgi:DNA-binding response OmpR family regulator
MSKLITLTHEQLDEFAHSVGAHVAAKVLAGLEAAGRLKPQVATTTTLGPLVVDFAGHEASVDGTRLVLQPRKFRVLAALAQHVGQVLSRDVLLELAYPDPGAVTDRVIDVQIFRLRKAFGTHAA